MEDILERIKNEGLEFLTIDALSGALCRSDRAKKPKYYHEVQKLLSEGKLMMTGSSVALSDTLGIVKGRLNGNARGFAFCRIEGESSPDIFIPNGALGGALHKDVVLVKINKNSVAGESEGVVVRVVERNQENIVGRLELSKKAGFVQPDDSHYFSDIYVTNLKEIKVKNGDKVVVRVDSYNQRHNSPQGKIVEVLGSATAKGVDILSIIREHNLYEEFPDEVERAARAVPQVVSANEKARRVDFTKDRVVTIDGEEARDFDDAISIVKHKDGSFTLNVHIADVSFYVTQGSVLDKEAYKRGTSVYFPDRVLPMLPKELSNGICSLNPNEERLVLSVIMDINPQGAVTGHKICEGVIKSKYRMTYTDVFAILEGNEEVTKKYGDYAKDFKLMEELHNILAKLREKRGSLDFDLPEPYIHLDNRGKVVDITQYPRNAAHKLIESFMVLANETVAQEAFNKTIPFVYRVHERPDSLKMGNFFAFLGGFSIVPKVNPESITPKILQGILRGIEGKPYADVVNKVMLRSLQKARYAPNCLGHFGLASTYYCHFTSPIRRYPDLVIHRIIRELFFKGGKQAGFFKEFVPEASLQSSTREKLAEMAERAVDDLKKAEFMQDKIGEEFDAIISGVTNFGVFVELPNTVEGMVRIEKLPQDNYVLDEKQYMLRGRTQSFQLGSRVRVKCISVNLSARKVDFEISKKF